ncbi:putative endonuclease [Curtobacterium phage Parvaparticeps]|nr:putative endonuclease [Curtobacterium phage Parvaparticeps]
MAATLTGPGDGNLPLYGGTRSAEYQELIESYGLGLGIRLLAVDPGGEHVGVACFQQNSDATWECVWAGEYEPLEFEDWLSEAMVRGQIDILVVEEFRLFPDKAAQQTGSDMPTSRLIGAIQYIWRMTQHVEARWPATAPEFHFQPPSIKTPTRSLMRARSITSMSKFLKIPLDHAADAELHGYYHILNTRKEKVHLHLLRQLQDKRANRRKKK